jgi:hypothetical protein
LFRDVGRGLLRLGLRFGRRRRLFDRHRRLGLSFLPSDFGRGGIGRLRLDRLFVVLLRPLERVVEMVLSVLRDNHFRPPVLRLSRRRLGRGFHSE